MKKIIGAFLFLGAMTALSMSSKPAEASGGACRPKGYSCVAAIECCSHQCGGLVFGCK